MNRQANNRPDLTIVRPLDISQFKVVCSMGTDQQNCCDPQIISLWPGVVVDMIHGDVGLSPGEASGDKTAFDIIRVDYPPVGVDSACWALAECWCRPLDISKAALALGVTLRPRLRPIVGAVIWVDVISGQVLCTGYVACDNIDGPVMNAVISEQVRGTIVGLEQHRARNEFRYCQDQRYFQVLHSSGTQCVIMVSQTAMTEKTLALKVRILATAFGPNRRAGNLAKKAFDPKNRILVTLSDAYRPAKKLAFFISEVTKENGRSSRVLILSVFSMRPYKEQHRFDLVRLLNDRPYKSQLERSFNHFSKSQLEEDDFADVNHVLESLVDDETAPLCSAGMTHLVQDARLSRLVQDARAREACEEGSENTCRQRRRADDITYQTSENEEWMEADVVCQPTFTFQSKELGEPALAWFANHRTFHAKSIDFRYVAGIVPTEGNFPRQGCALRSVKSISQVTGGQGGCCSLAKSHLPRLWHKVETGVSG
ncbi:hypothetical protein CEK25_002251 [Fusarium fujikuroi]|nr:hypothetical protein CEK25_002251 [Fusarium fujikuroi]